MEEEREDKERSFLRGLLIRIESKSFILPMLPLVAACSPLLVTSPARPSSSSSSSSSSQTSFRLRSLTTMISLPLLDLNEGNEEEEVVEEAARWRSSSLLLNRCDDAKAVAK